MWKNLQIHCVYPWQMLFLPICKLIYKYYYNYKLLRISSNGTFWVSFVTMVTRQHNQRLHRVTWQIFCWTVSDCLYLFTICYMIEKDYLINMDQSEYLIVVRNTFWNIHTMFSFSWCLLRDYTCMIASHVVSEKYEIFYTAVYDIQNQ